MIENGIIDTRSLGFLSDLATEHNVKVVVCLNRDNVSISITPQGFWEMESEPTSTVVKVKSKDDFRKLQEDLRKEGWGI